MNEKFNGNADSTFRGGQSVAQLDPVIMISAMAAATNSVSFAITGTTSYIHVRGKFSKIPSFDQFH